jgi:hypothetical protein
MSIFGILWSILFTPLSFLWQLLNQFLLSPWGLVAPMTLLIALVAVQYIQRTPPQLALFYAEQLETCDESEIPRLLKNLIQMGDAGVPGLVKGLTSQRESVFTACLNVLQYEFNRWQESPRREHYFCVFSETLLQMCGQFSPATQTEAMRFVDQMMQIRSTAATDPESTTNRQKTIVHCERILSLLESQRRRRIAPKDKDFDSSTDSVASLDRRTRQPMLLASNGQPFVPTSGRQEKNEMLVADANSFNPFSVPRADRLMAYQRAQQNRPSEDRSHPRLPDDREIPGIASFSPPSPFVAEMEQQFAQNFAPDAIELPTPPDISEEYRNKKRNESGGSFNSDNFLTPELQNTPLDRVPNLPTTQLMQLLHHSEAAYVDSARRTLMSRDGFQESHMKLAWRLYHPVPAVRQEIAAMFPNTPNVQSSVWLRELLNDPSNDVRYRTVSFLATTNDPALRQLVIERGKRDTDARIVNLADRLNDSQGSVLR